MSRGASATEFEDGGIGVLASLCNPILHRALAQFGFGRTQGLRFPGRLGQERGWYFVARETGTATAKTKQPQPPRRRGYGERIRSCVLRCGVVAVACVDFCRSGRRLARRATHGQCRGLRPIAERRPQSPYNNSFVSRPCSSYSTAPSDPRPCTSAAHGVEHEGSQRRLQAPTSIFLDPH